MDRFALVSTLDVRNHTMRGKSGVILPYHGTRLSLLQGSRLEQAAHISSFALCFHSP